MRGRGARLFEVAVCDLKRDPDGRVADAALPDAARTARGAVPTSTLPEATSRHPPPGAATRNLGLNQGN